MAALREMDRAGSHWALLTSLALLYFTLNALLLGLVTPTAEWDHAEQLILSQVWRLGYNSQPPLYTWLVRALFLATGPSLPVLLGLKAILLTLVVSGVALTAREMGLGTAQQSLAVLGLALIPQIVWEDQRNFTHTVLTLAVASWTLFQFLRLARRRLWTDYALWGALVGLGMLGKYNYGLFIAGLVAAALTIPVYRRALWTPRLLVSAAVALALVLPHLLWVVGNAPVAAEGFHKLEMSRGVGWGALADLGAGLIASLGVLILAVPIVVRRSSWRSALRAPACRLLASAFVAMLALAVALLIVSGARDVREHWLQPMIFYAPLMLACAANPGARALSAFQSIAVVVLLGVSVALPGQALFADPQRPSRLNHPYRELARQIRDQAGAPAFVLADSDPLAGNLRLGFPGAVVMSPRSFFPDLVPPGDWVVVGEVPPTGTSELGSWLRRRLGVEPSAVHSVAAPYYYLDGREYRLYWSFPSGAPQGR
jgi:4-amino-4-deoxy-L-arabinose transferase-like glycosyltransferase